VLLLHGFPYDPWSYVAVADGLAAAGGRVIAPYLRGFGPTRFLHADILRSGEQAALGTDLIEMIAAMGVNRPIVAGYDWGGRAACVAAAVRPDLVGALVTAGGYNLFGRPTTEPLPPETEHVLWYQYYLHTERGRTMLERNRRGFCRLLWTLWSPAWPFSEETFEQSAASLDCPDFVEVVLHSYRHRSGLAAGDPTLQDLADKLESVLTLPQDELDVLKNASLRIVATHDIQTTISTIHPMVFMPQHGTRGVRDRQGLRSCAGGA